MNTSLQSKLKPELLTKGSFDKNNIFILENKDCIKDDNEKYIKMYNWMSYEMNFMEKVIGRFAYGKQIEKASKQKI